MMATVALRAQTISSARARYGGVWGLVVLARPSIGRARSD
jgi:hypothetical protein